MVSAGMRILSISGWVGQSAGVRWELIICRLQYDLHDNKTSL